ncbi:pyridoxal-phosphate dependent enzyme [Haloechinothrix sp. LS1_15]|uniref:threonine ammonia-lyase n=1 Tax=Haloechinothrix sp. LS1_15 TaxID=2652248 RepID=UPI00294AF83C|nr:pyridoxal-phosphate dependent enzyme [Haloechinothrix sp. LS1_15]
MDDTLDLRPERIDRAAAIIDPVFLDSPQFVDEQLSARIGTELLVKLETANPLHSFKGRGACALLHGIPPGSSVVCDSGGNFGQAVAYAGRSRGVDVTVFVGPDVDPGKASRMRDFGARVYEVDGDTAVAARQHAAEQPDRVLVRDGRDPAICEGAGTIGRELLRDARGFDTVVVPVGDGALIAGIGCWLEAYAPQVRVVGVCAEGSPAMARAWRTGEIDDAGHASDIGTIATTLANPAPIPESLRRLRALVDDIVLVDDAALRQGMALAADTLGVLLEPAGAAAIAALATAELATERAAVVLTGSNPAPELAREVLGASTVPSQR